MAEEPTEYSTLLLRSDVDTDLESSTPSMKNFAPNVRNLPTSVVFSWRNVSASATYIAKPKALESGPTPSKKYILSATYGIAYPGQVFVISGGSGAGKTTLLNILTFNTNRSSQKLLQTKGEIYVNGSPVTQDYLSSISSYVYQMDYFIGTLTVKEHLTFHAMLRIPSSVAYASKVIRVSQVIEQLGLVQCQNVHIGIPGKLKGISGGEMKRLSFATELLTDSPLLFCDEPISGLDCVLAENVMSILKSLAAEGKTIICTVHQPSSQVYAMFDRILLLSNGKTIFSGETSQILPFFAENGYDCPANFNPNDFLIRTLAHDEELTSLQLSKAFEASGMAKETKHLIQDGIDNKKVQEQLRGFVTGYNASWFTQIRLICWRTWLSFTRNLHFVLLNFLQTLFYIAFVSSMYYGQQLNQEGIQNLNGAVFLLLLNAVYQTMFQVMDVFTNELPIFLRENDAQLYRTDAYFLGRSTVDIPITIVSPALIIGTCYFIIGFQPSVEAFLKILILFILVGQSARSLGYVLSCLFTTVQHAIAIGPAVVLPLSLCSGFLLNLKSIPIYFVWIKWISMFHYAFEGTLIQQWANVDHIECDQQEDSMGRGEMAMAGCLLTGIDVLAKYGIDPEKPFWLDVVQLLGLIVGLQSLAFLLLLYRTYAK